MNHYDITLGTLGLALIVVLVSSICLDSKINAYRCFPYLTFFSLYYFAFYFLDPFLIHAFRPVQSPEHRVDRPFPTVVELRTAIFVILFVLAHVVGFLSTAVPIARARANHYTPPATDQSTPLKVFAMGGIFMYFPIKISQGFGIPGLSNLATPSWYLGIAIFSLFALSNRLNVPDKLFLAAAGALFIGTSIVDGFLTPILFSLSIVMSAAFFLRRYRILLAAAVVALLIFPAYGFVKELSSDVSGDSAGKNLKTWSRDPLTDSLLRLARRATHLQFLQHVVDQVPSEIPYANGRPFRRTVLNHVPRVLWPEKPIEFLGNQLGKEYGVVDESDDQTSWNIPWTVDFYRQDGFQWLPFYGFLTGLLIGTGVGLMSTGNNQTLWFGIYSASVFPLYYQESNFSLMAGSVLWIILIFFVGYKMLQVFLRRLWQSSD